MNIPLGFEVGTGRRVEIPLRHLAVTGQTQESGKTTTLEGLITRSGLRAVAFLTKRGEGSFRVAHTIPPYFREPTDTAETPMWFWVKSILEATQQQKMGIKEASIIRASEKAKTLEQVHENVREMAEESRSGFVRDMCTCLDAYFSRVLPQIRRLPTTKELKLEKGVNVMDLGDYTEELQALVIRSVLEYVYLKCKNTIVIIPEAWKFVPRARGSPVGLAAEAYIRQGAALKNYLWLDSQDLAGIATPILKSISVWILGVQRELNEVKRTLGYITISPEVKPRDIQQLGKGQFFACFGREAWHVYVQPAWMNEVHAEAIARGQVAVESARAILRDLDRESVSSKILAESVRSNFVEPDSPAEEEAPAAAPEPGTETVPSAEESEEAMWKEKFEKAEKEIARLREIIIARDGAIPAPPAAVNPPAADHGFAGLPANWGDVRSALFEYIKRRAMREPELLVLLTHKPAIEVRVERPKLELDGKSLQGMVARLVHDGYFAEPKTGTAVQKELKRRGMDQPSTNVYRALNTLNSAGFLTNEAAGYQAVAGMDVKVREARA